MGNFTDTQRVEPVQKLVLGMVATVNLIIFYTSPLSTLLEVSFTFFLHTTFSSLSRDTSDSVHIRIYKIEHMLSIIELLPVQTRFFKRKFSVSELFLED